MMNEITQTMIIEDVDEEDVYCVFLQLSNNI